MKSEEYRTILNTWWRGLTDEQKKAVPITQLKTIDLHQLFSYVPIKYDTLRMYLKEDINKIDEELKSLGVLPDSEEYKVRLLNWWQS
ncbi:hypothetical protein, partial [Vibrio anguillarum]